MCLQNGWALAQPIVIVIVFKMLAHWALELRDRATRQRETEERAPALPFCSLVFLLKWWDWLVGPGWPESLDSLRL